MNNEVRRIVLKEIKENLYELIIISQDNELKRYENVQLDKVEELLLTNISKIKDSDFYNLSGKEIIEKLVNNQTLKFVDKNGNDLDIENLFVNDNLALSEEDYYDPDEGYDFDDASNFYLTNKIKKIIFYSDDESFDVFLESGIVNSYNNERISEDRLQDLYRKILIYACEHNECSDAHELQEKEILVIKNKRETNKLIETVKNNKIKNLITKKRLISLAVVAALVATGFGISELKNKKSGNSKDNKNNNTIEDSIDKPILDPFDQEVAIDELRPTAAPINYFVQPDISFTPREFILENNQVVVEIHNGAYSIHSYGEKEYETFEKLQEYSLENMDDLANFIQNSKVNPKLTTTGKYIVFERFFDNEVDRAVISHFDKYRNSIILEAYDSKDMDKARFYINEANKELVRFIYDNNSIQYLINNELKYATYNDLTPNARAILDNIAWSMFQPFVKDNFEYNGEIYDQTKVAERVFGIEVEKSK